MAKKWGSKFFLFAPLAKLSPHFQNRGAAHAYFVDILGIWLNLEWYPDNRPVKQKNPKAVVALVVYFNIELSIAVALSNVE